MKEKIYTIPVNEAYEADCECPLCFLESKLESDAVDYALGAAMMEPDYRMESNEKGYCRHHFSMMFAKPNKLSLALVLDTHLEEICKKIKKHEKEIESLQKTGLFSKKNHDAAENLEKTLHTQTQSCIICDRINHTMERYLDVLLYLFENDENFRKCFEASKGLCLPHFEALIRVSKKSMGTTKRNEFLQVLYRLQEKELARIQEDIHRFTLKFDYRNQNMEWGTAKDAPVRSIEKITGTIFKTEE